MCSGWVCEGAGVSGLRKQLSKGSEAWDCVGIRRQERGLGIQRV